jgi:hypothetical protein
VKYREVTGNATKLLVMSEYTACKVNLVISSVIRSSPLGSHSKKEEGAII